MWKYVSRRIKDSVERTYNVLETRRTWTCGGEKLSQASDQDDEKKVCRRQKLNKNVYSYEQNVDLVASRSSSSSGGFDEEYKSKQSYKHHECKFQQNILGVLTWSSALVCGWYTSQILCMKRKQQFGWNSNCKFSNALFTQTHGFHTSILSPWMIRNQRKIHSHHQPPQYSTVKQQQLFSSFSHHFDKEVLIVREINNDTELLNDSNNNVHAKELPTKVTTVNDAVQDLLQVIGDIEFQLGIQNIDAERYVTAANHFKSGTSHHHIGATFNLGICYELGIGVKQDLKMALECYVIAASMGHAKATYNVGVFHARGLGGLVKNRRAGRQYILEAAKLGLVEAQRALGTEPIATTFGLIKPMIRDQPAIESVIYNTVSVS